MTDTPVPLPTVPPPPKIDQVKALIGDLARPFAIYAVAFTTASAIFIGKDVGVITAAGVILAALYGTKTIEVQQAGKQAASVEIAKAASTTAAP